MAVAWQSAPLGIRLPAIDLAASPPAGVPAAQPLLPALVAALECGSAEEARRRIMQSLSARWNAQVILGWKTAGRWEVCSSNAAKMDRRTDAGRAIVAALAETCLQTDLLRWQGTSGPPTYRQLAEVAAVTQVAGMPLAAQDDAAPAALLLLGSTEPLSRSEEAHLWEAAPTLSGMVQILAEASPTPLGRFVRRARQFARGRRSWLALAAALALVAVGIVPVPERISCSATLEPAVRRYVVAPQDGILQRALVQAGEQVLAGQPLALLDRRPVEIELSVLMAERDEAARRRDAARARGQAADAQLADLEAAQAERKIEHLQNKLRQLTVASPIAGVVVRGDLQRVEGAALTRGQNLFEVAPLDPLVAEVAIPEDEVRLAAVGMPVTLWPAAHPGRSVRGVIGRLHPRAEVLNGQAVFVAEVELSNAAGDFKPGMQTSAVVWGDSRPLAWTVVRRPITRTLRSIGW